MTILPELLIPVLLADGNSSPSGILVSFYHLKYFFPDNHLIQGMDIFRPKQAKAEHPEESRS
jgi:hypothetical protein